MIITASAVIIACQFAAIIYLVLVCPKSPLKAEAPATNTPEKVGKFYNETTTKFLQVYGEIIQAFRTNKVEDYLAYTLQSAELKADMKIVDAGCGICGPASYFAAQLPGLQISACTISEVQQQMGEQKLKDKNV